MFVRRQTASVEPAPRGKLFGLMKKHQAAADHAFLEAATKSSTLNDLVNTGVMAAVIGGFAMTRFPVYFCEIVCDEDEGCRPELYEEQVFKAENDCDEVACTPKFVTEGEEESA